MQHKDYYKILGVDRNATPETIRIAYRKLARKYHPDISKEKNAEERFKEIGEAYEFLKNTANRSTGRQAHNEQRTTRPHRPPQDWTDHFAFSDNPVRDGVKSGIGTIFGTLLSRARNSMPPRAKSWLGGRDYQAKLTIDLNESYQGANRRISLHLPRSRKIGASETIERILNVRIPKGIKPGQRIRLTGQGIPGNRGLPAGDLFLEVEFKAHPFFRVKGCDVYLDLPVAPWEAVLGAKIKIPTPAGSVEVQIPAGSRHGSQIRLKNRGIPGSPNGHLYATIQIDLPSAKSEKEKNVYRDMARRLPFNPRAKFDEND